MASVQALRATGSRAGRARLMTAPIGIPGPCPRNILHRVDREKRAPPRRLPARPGREHPLPPISGVPSPVSVALGGGSPDLSMNVRQRACTRSSQFDLPHQARTFASPRRDGFFCHEGMPVARPSRSEEGANRRHDASPPPLAVLLEFSRWARGALVDDRARQGRSLSLVPIDLAHRADACRPPGADRSSCPRFARSASRLGARISVSKARPFGMMLSTLGSVRARRDHPPYCRSIFGRRDAARKRANPPDRVAGDRAFDEHERATVAPGAHARDPAPVDDRCGTRALITTSALPELSHLVHR